MSGSTGAVVIVSWRRRCSNAGALRLRAARRRGGLRTARWWVAAAIAAAGLLGGATEARALGGTVLQGFDPPSDPFAYVVTEGAKALEPGAFFAAVYCGWALGPLRVPGVREKERRERLIQEAHEIDLVGGLGLLPLGFGSLEVGFALPVLVRIRGYGGGKGYREWGVGDVRVEAKAELLDRDEDVVGVALRVAVACPSATLEREELYGNAGGLAVLAEAAVERRVGAFRAGLTLGYEWIEYSADLGEATIDDRLEIAAGFGFAPLFDLRGFEPLELVFEVRHAVRAADPYASEAEAPVELCGAIRWSDMGSRFFGLAGGSTGLNDGAGAPERRFFAALGFGF